MALAQSFRSLEAIVRSIVIARTLGIESYAVYAVVIAFVGTTQEFFNLNLGAAVIKYGSDYLHQGDQQRISPLVSASYLVTLLAAFGSVIAVSVIVSLAYEVFFNVQDLHWYIVGFALAASGAMVDANNKAVLRLFDRFKLSSMLDAVVSVLSILVFSLSVVLFTMDLMSFMLIAIGYSAVSAMLSSAVTAWELKRIETSVWTIQAKPIIHEMKTIFELTTLNSLSMTIQRFMRKGDVLLLQLLSNGKAVGIYDVAKKVTSSILLLKGPLALSAFPQVSRLVAKQDFVQLRDMLVGVYRYLVPIAVIGLIVTALVGEEVVSACYGPEYEGSSVTLFFLAGVASLYVLFFWGNSFVLSLGRYRLQFVSHLIGLSVSAVLGCILIPFWGANGMAFASFCGLAAIYGIYGVFTFKILSADSEPAT